MLLDRCLIFLLRWSGDEKAPIRVRGQGTFDLSAHNLTLRLLLRFPPEKRGKSLSSLSTKGLQKLSQELSESLQRWRKRFPATGYEALSEAIRHIPPAFGISRPFEYLSPKREPSREYLEISRREQLLEEIDRELLQREDEQEFTSTSGRQKAVLGQSQPMTEPPSNRARVNDYIDEVQRVTGKRITRADIWKEAKYKSRTEFERWERQDPMRRNKTAELNFERVLTEKQHLKKN